MLLCSRRFRHSALAIAFALASLTACSRAHATTNVCSMGPFVDGVDVYSGDGAIDWKAAAGAGIEFAYIKASQGNYFSDDRFATNWAQTKANGVLRGAYHFYDPNVDGTVQADYFLNILGPITPGDLPPMIDVECPDGDKNCLGGASGAASAATISKSLHDLIARVESKTGKKPVIYTFGAYFSSNNVPTTGLSDLPLYIAYPTTGDCFNVPDPWTSAAFWQWSWTGTVAGINSGVDRDRFMGTKAQLLAFINGFETPSQVNGNDAMSLVSWADGHTELFATGVNGDALHLASQGSAMTETWSKAASIGSGGVGCGLASVAWGPSSTGQSVTVWSAKADGTTSALSWDPVKKAWGAFVPDGGKSLSRLSTVTFTDGHVESFALGADGAIWHDAGTAGKMAGWSKLDAATATTTFVTGAAPIVWGDGHAEIFATDKNGVVFHDYTNTASPPVWQGWKPITGVKVASRPIPARWADGHVSVFARSADNRLVISDYTKDAWPAFAPLNPTEMIEGEPSVLVYRAYGPEVFARDPSGDLVHMWTSPGEGGITWSAWSNDFAQKLTSDPMAWLRSDGTAEVFGVDDKGALVMSVHTGSTWTKFAALGTGFDACIDGKAAFEPDGGAPNIGDSDAGAGDAGIEDTYQPGGGSGGCACNLHGTSEHGTGLALVLSGLLAGGFVARRRRFRS